jgi:hypothetical protein
MIEPLNIDEIVKNSNIDPQALSESRKLLNDLRQRGMRRAEYGLTSPVDRHRASVGDKGCDPRTVHLRPEK